MDAWIYPYYYAENNYYQIPQDVHFGHYCAGQFYSHEVNYDFSQQGVPVLWSQAMGYQQLPYGTIFLFYFNQQWFRTKNEALEAVNQYLMLTMSAYQVPASPPVNPALSQPAEAVVAQPQKAAAKKNCTGCQTPNSEFLIILGKCLCIDCLFTRYTEDKFVCDVKNSKDPKEWTAKIIAEVHNFLNSHLVEEKKSALPASIKLPPNSFICVGRDEAVFPGHPASGHIAGNPSKCMEDACPNHEYCKGCALKTSTCRFCNSFIAYEDFPPCPSNCATHQHSFTVPCPTCHAITPRTKGRPPNS